MTIGCVRHYVPFPCREPRYKTASLLPRKVNYQSQIPPTNVLLPQLTTVQWSPTVYTNPRVRAGSTNTCTVKSPGISSAYIQNRTKQCVPSQHPVPCPFELQPFPSMVASSQWSDGTLPTHRDPTLPPPQLTTERGPELPGLVLPTAKSETCVWQVLLPQEPKAPGSGQCHQAHR